MTMVAGSSAYGTDITDEQITTWANTDETTLYDGKHCLNESQEGANGYSDILEARVCHEASHNLDELDQLGPWLLEDYTMAPSDETDTLLPDHIKYRTYDFRKFMGTNAWAVMAIVYYELESGDATYRPIAEAALEWIDSYREDDPDSPAFGAISMGRVWRRGNVDAPGTEYGFLDWQIYITEHNLDVLAAYHALALLTDNPLYVERADQIKAFLLRELWAPHVDLAQHPEVTQEDVDNIFFAALRMLDDAVPQGEIDTECVYLDGQSWSILALGPATPVLDKDGEPATISTAMQYVMEHLLVEGAVIYPGTGFEVNGIDGFRESLCDEDEGHENPDGLVWSEGSEGVVSALYLQNWNADTAYYHAETASHTMPNGGVPYSTLPKRDDDVAWPWTDTPSIAGTAWYHFNHYPRRLNPFRPTGIELPMSNAAADDVMPALIRRDDYLALLWQREGQILIRTSTDSGAIWSAELTVTNGTDPASVIDDNGMLHFVYTEAGSVWYAKLDSVGNVLGNPTELGQGCWPDLATDAVGNPYVVWKRLCNGTGFTEVLFRRSGNGGVTFSAETTVGSISRGWSDPPKIAVSPTGIHIYAIWKSRPPAGNYNRTYFARSLNGGSSFLPAQNPTDFVRHAEYDPAIAAWGENTVYISWVLDQYGDRLTQFSRSTDAGATFGERLPVGTVADNFESDIDVHANGSICLTWRRNRDLVATCTHDGGRSFPMPERIGIGLLDSTRRQSFRFTGL